MANRFETAGRSLARGAARPRPVRFVGQPAAERRARTLSPGGGAGRALSFEEALRLASVPNVKQGGQRLRKCLTEGEAGKLLGVPDGKTRIGMRDRALLALLVACGLRRDELVRLEVRHLQLRDERRVLADLSGKGRRIRTVPVPLWVKRLVDRWLEEAGRKARYSGPCAKVEHSSPLCNRSVRIWCTRWCARVARLLVIRS